MGLCPALAIPGGAIHTVPEKQRASHLHQETSNWHLKGSRGGSPAFGSEGRLLARIWKREVFHQGGGDLPTGAGVADSQCGTTGETVDPSQSPPGAQHPAHAVWGWMGSLLPLTRLGEISTFGSTWASSASSDYRGEKRTQSTECPHESSRRQSYGGCCLGLRARGLAGAGCDCSRVQVQVWNKQQPKLLAPPLALPTVFSTRSVD